MIYENKKSERAKCKPECWLRDAFYQMGSIQGLFWKYSYYFESNLKA